MTSSGAGVTLPDRLRWVMSTTPRWHHPSQAFPLITTDVSGFPRVALLSSAELRLTPSGLHLAMASRHSAKNLERSGRAALTVVEGTTQHTLCLSARRSIRVGGLLACELDISEHRQDSLGIQLTPMTFVATPQLAISERWDLSKRALTRLRERPQ